MLQSKPNLFYAWINIRFSEKRQLNYLMLCFCQLTVTVFYLRPEKILQLCHIFQRTHSSRKREPQYACTIGTCIDFFSKRYLLSYLNICTFNGFCQALFCSLQTHLIKIQPLHLFVFLWQKAQKFCKAVHSCPLLNLSLKPSPRLLSACKQKAESRLGRGGEVSQPSIPHHIFFLHLSSPFYWLSLTVL